MKRTAALLVGSAAGLTAQAADLATMPFPAHWVGRRLIGEANPIVLLITGGDPGAALALKAGAVAIAFCLVWLMVHRYPTSRTMPFVALAAMTLLGLIGAASNEGVLTPTLPAP